MTRVIRSTSKHRVGKVRMSPNKRNNVAQYKPNEKPKKAGFWYNIIRLLCPYYPIKKSKKKPKSRTSKAT